MSRCHAVLNIETQTSWACALAHVLLKPLTAHLHERGLTERARLHVEPLSDMEVGNRGIVARRLGRAVECGANHGPSVACHGVLRAEHPPVRNVFGKVVSPTVARRLLAGDPASLRDGHRQDVAILFCDIRSFTTMSETSRPEEVVKLLNGYFTTMVDVIARHQGVVDKYIGDAILAVFGLDEPSAAAENAVRCAIEMTGRAGEFTTPQGATLANGAGNHFGTVVAGTIGSPDRFEYTVIGDAVNTASRLEGLTKGLGRAVVISEQVAQKIPPDLKARFAPLGAHQVKGREEHIEILGLADDGPHASDAAPAAHR